MGRKSKKSLLLRNIDVIRDMKKQGSTDLQIAKHLGVCNATWYKLLKECPELREAVDDGRKELETELIGELVKLAKGGFVLTTKKTVIKSDKDGSGVILEEITEKEQPPNYAALTFLLRNLSDTWANDPQSLELRKKEVELKEKALENNAW